MVQCCPGKTFEPGFDFAQPPDVDTYYSWWHQSFGDFDYAQSAELGHNHFTEAGNMVAERSRSTVAERSPQSKEQSKIANLKSPITNHLVS